MCEASFSLATQEYANLLPNKDKIKNLSTFSTTRVNFSNIHLPLVPKAIHRRGRERREPLLAFESEAMRERTDNAPKDTSEEQERKVWKRTLSITLTLHTGRF